MSSISTRRIFLHSLLQRGGAPAIFKLFCQKLHQLGEKSSELEQQQLAKEIERAHDILKLEKKSLSHYILDKNVADCVVEKVCERLPGDAVVLECNPGIGLVTTGLLKSSKISKLILAEAKTEFISHVQKLQTYRSKVELVYERLNFIAPRRYDEKEAFYRVLNYVQPKTWEEDTPLSLIGVVPMTCEDQFMARLVVTLVHRDFIYSLGRTECYLFVSANQFRKVKISFPTKDNRVHHQSSILYNLLFDSECLMQVDKKLFSPPLPTRKRRLVTPPLLSDSDALDRDMMYLIHLKPKLNLAQDVLDWEELPKFIVFLKQITRIRLARLIPKMESWVPGCGIHLIHMNYTMMDYIQDLVPTQYVQLYKEMLSWPEYQESSLQLLLEKEVSILNEDDNPDSTDSHVELAVT